MDQTTSQIARELSELREAAHLTQYEAAHAIGVTPQTISRWERGERRPRAQDYLRAKTEYERRISGLDQSVSRGTPQTGGRTVVDVMRSRQVQIRIKEAELEFLKAGADERELTYLRALLTDPASMVLREGGWTEPQTPTEEMQDLEVVVEMGRVWLREHMKRRKGAERERRRQGREDAAK